MSTEIRLHENSKYMMGPTNSPAIIMKINQNNIKCAQQLFLGAFAVNHTHTSLLLWGVETTQVQITVGGGGDNRFKASQSWNGSITSSSQLPK